MAYGGGSSSLANVQASLRNKAAGLQGQLTGQLGISDFNAEGAEGIGISVTGAQQYLQDLKVNGIDAAIEALNKTETFTNVFREYWQGRAEANFEQNTYSAIQTITSQLEIIKEQIENQVSDMIEDWAIQDENLVELSDEIVNFGE